MSGGWHLPFEDDPVGNAPISDARNMILAGSITVMAATAPTGMGMLLPLLVFRFTGSDGQMFPPIALVLDDEHIAHVPGLVTAAVEAARKAAAR